MMKTNTKGFCKETIEKLTKNWPGGSYLVLRSKPESMSAIRFRTTTKGNLPHLSYIFRKPDPLSTEFKNVACSVTGALIFIEVQRGEGRDEE